MPTYIRRAVILFMSILCLSCSEDKSTNEQEAPEGIQKPWNEELAIGQINGQPWSFQSGSAHIIHKNLQYYLLVRLWNEKLNDPCEQEVGTALQVRLVAPKRIDSWSIQDPFEAKFSIFFSDREFKPRPLDNLKADAGKITLISITKLEVSGVFNGSYTHRKVGPTEVHGAFTVPVCTGSNASFGDNF